MRRKRKLYLTLIGYVSGFVALAAITAAISNLAHEEANSNHSSVSNARNSQTEIAQSTSMETLATFHREPQSYENQVFRTIGTISNDETLYRSGIRARRARRVKFQARYFYQIVQADRPLVQLNLFDDTKLVSELRPASLFSQNAGALSGIILHDPGSEVRLFVEGATMNGFVRAQGHTYRIVFLGEGLDHLIVEEDP